MATCGSFPATEKKKSRQERNVGQFINVAFYLSPDYFHCTLNYFQSDCLHNITKKKEGGKEGKEEKGRKGGRRKEGKKEGGLLEGKVGGREGDREGEREREIKSWHYSI